jgi:outer membrane lipoprotein-sorting protein
MLGLILILSASCAHLSANWAHAAPSATEILNRLLAAQRNVRDYTAAVSVSVNIPNVDLPPRTAKVYVKFPDKVYVESSSIVLIPKQALLLGELAKQLQRNTDLVLAGSRQDGARTIYCIKIIPKDTVAPKGHEPRVMVWVDSSRWVVEKVQALSGAVVEATAQFTYGQFQGVWMPTRVLCTIPKRTLGADRDGTATVEFRDYRLNTGLTDEFFAKKQAAEHRRHH